jgi:hypothetical protein
MSSRETRAGFPLSSPWLLPSFTWRPGGSAFALAIKLWSSCPTQKMRVITRVSRCWSQRSW